MTTTDLDPNLAAALKAKADRLHARAAGLVRVDGVLLWGVRLSVCRAFVWAEYRRADVGEACLVAFYGRDAGYGPSALSHAAAMAKRLAQVAAAAP